MPSLGRQQYGTTVWYNKAAYCLRVTGLCLVCHVTRLSLYCVGAGWGGDKITTFSSGANVQ